MRRSVTLVALILAMPNLLPGQASGRSLPWGSADSIVAIGQGQIGLKASAWRDFMPRPGGIQAGSDLMVNRQLQGLDGRPLATGIMVDSAWVRSSEGLWTSAPAPSPAPGCPTGWT